MEGSPFNLFGDPDEFRARMEELSEQMQYSQRVAWADNAIKLAVEMTVASIGQLDLTGGPDQQAMQVRDAIRVLFPEAVTLAPETGFESASRTRPTRVVFGSGITLTCTFGATPMLLPVSTARAPLC